MSTMADSQHSVAFTDYSSTESVDKLPGELRFSSPRKSRDVKRYFRVALNFIVMALTVRLAIKAYRGTTTNENMASLAPRVRTMTCGSTAAEAVASNCVFDPILVHWTPEPCADHETLEEFELAGPWIRREDTPSGEMGAIIPHEKLGHATYWISEREHSVHCAFVNLRLHR